MADLEQKVADLAVKGESTEEEEEREKEKRVQETPHVTLTTGLIYDEGMLHHRNDISPNHPEVPERISRAWEGLSSRGITARCQVLKAREATKDEVTLVHNEQHYQLVASTADMTPEKHYQLSLCFSSIFFNSFTFQAAKLAAGCVTEITEQVVLGKIRNGLALVRPPGHHAECEFSMGFCHFNNVAVAAQYAVDKLGLERVLIIDWDVHHGNGTQHSFYSDKRILYMSLHRYDNGLFYPGSHDADYNCVGGAGAEGFNINVAWNWDSMGDAEYLSAFHYIIMPVAYEYNPQLVIVSSGFDAAEGDPLGQYHVTPAGYAHMTHLLSSLANGKLVVAMEGGYNLTSIEYSTAAIACVLLGNQPLPPLEALSPCDSAVRSILQTGHTHSKYWDSLKVFADIQFEEASEPKEEVNEESYLNPHKPGPVDHQHEQQSQISNVIPSSVEQESPVSINQFGRSGPWLDIANVYPSSVTPSSVPAETGDTQQPLPTANVDGAVPLVTPGPSGATGGGGGGAVFSISKDQLSSSEQAVVNSMEEAGVSTMFAVTPKSWCEHLDGHVKPLPPDGIDASKVCEVCQTAQEPWVCLTCYHVYCGRYVNQHMLEHQDSSGHKMVLSLADISVWCFACDSYIDNHVLRPAINSAHHSKFGCYADGTS